MATNLYLCPENTRSCELADAVAQRCLRPGIDASAQMIHAFSYAAACLPCSRCRKADAQVDQLVGTRLGRHERNILLYSPSPSALTAAILDPELSSHAERETYLRAVRKLSRIGLIQVDSRSVRLNTSAKRKDGTIVARSYIHRTLQQSELGSLVVRFYRHDLEANLPIRWSRHIDDIRHAYRWSLQQLLRVFSEQLDHYMSELAVQKSSSLAQPHGDRQIRYLLQPFRDALNKL